MGFIMILGGGNSNMVLCFTPNLWGRLDSRFDEHIFQMGWFNHRPAYYLCVCDFFLLTTTFSTFFLPWDFDRHFEEKSLVDFWSERFVSFLNWGEHHLEIIIESSHHHRKGNGFITFSKYRRVVSLWSGVPNSDTCGKRLKQIRH